MRIKGALVAFLLIIAGAGTCIAATFTLDHNNTVVRFTYQVGFVSQSANFGELSGVFKFDEAAPEHSYLNAVIKTASLKANQFEEKLKGEDFFNVTAWPEIRFVSHDFRPADGNRAELSGDLTMKGITKPITLHLAFNPAQAAIPSRGGATGGAQLIAESRILRSSFNMTALGFLVDDEIDIRFDAALQAKR
jgi:polyisoprenoid-binding protein YceI